MPSRTESAVYVALAAVVAVFVWFLLHLGLVGWLLAASLLATSYVLAKWSGLFGNGESSGRSTKVSCPGCGARNDADRETCHHCGDALPST